jgi:antitoxin (DNA-binding transcriptional repressor) of toxin-antitoxin stability system
MDAVNIYDAKTQLSQLVDRAAAGEEIVIGRHGRPLARLTRLVEPPRTIRFGLLKGRAKMARDFDSPLPDEVLAAFEGR